jgi:hypothetical protein
MVRWLANDELERMFKENGRGLIWGIIQKFTCRDWGKRWRTSARIIGVPAESWTGHLPNKGRSVISWANLLGGVTHHHSVDFVTVVQFLPWYSTPLLVLSYGVKPSWATGGFSRRTQLHGVSYDVTPTLPFRSILFSHCRWHACKENCKEKNIIYISCKSLSPKQA